MSKRGYKPVGWLSGLTWPGRRLGRLDALVARLPTREGLGKWGAEKKAEKAAVLRDSGRATPEPCPTGR